MPTLYQEGKDVEDRGDNHTSTPPASEQGDVEKPQGEMSKPPRQKSSRDRGLLHRLTRCRLPLIIDIPLRGFGQVVFCDNDITGVAFIVALAIADPWLTVLAVVGCMAGVLVGAFAQFDMTFLRMGLTGYNGVLVGCGFAVFMTDDPWTWRPAIATLIGGAVQAFITLSAANMSTVPAWTFPFNYVLLVSLLMFQEPLSPEKTEVIATGYTHFSEVPAVDLLKAIPVGISQIFVVNNWISGIIIVLGIAVHDGRLAVSVVIGSIIGLLVGFAVEAEPKALTDGLWGYNPSLTAAAVCVFFQHTRQVFGLILWACVATQVLSCGMANAFSGAFRIPVCTIPFCIIATFSFLLRNHLRGYETPHTLARPICSRSSAGLEDDVLFSEHSSHVEGAKPGDEQKQQCLKDGKASDQELDPEDAPSPKINV